eukprot:Awhi_evm1s2871
MIHFAIYAFRPCSPLNTLPYATPEALEGIFNRTSDLWALAVITFELFTKTTPFQHGKKETTGEKIVHCKYEENMNKWAFVLPDWTRHLLPLVFKIYPEERLSIEEFIAELRKAEEYYYANCPIDEIID